MEQTLYDLLKSLNIEYQKLEHEPVFTCEASEDFYARNKLDGAKCKTLFLRNRKGDQHYMAVVLADNRVDIKNLTDFLDAGQRLSFASPERLQKHLGVTPGSVTPFALIHPEASNIPVVVDKGILAHDWVHFHPLRNTATLRLKKDDFLKFLKSRGNEVKFYEF
ncbi:prolyl-tRNA synthetase associated domain-containing protein [Candidatus Gracilibacteria bacterium]|nr:prolyl-tRNA synthetase associated domain-containing protein [Candidatus Gracilibacteria bacterium]